jgi:hypothetical protein
MHVQGRRSGFREPGGTGEVGPRWKGGCADGWIENGECRVRESVTLGMVGLEMVVIEWTRFWCS